MFEVTNQTEDYRVSVFGGEREQIEQFLRFVSADDVVWDIGANVGVYSIFASRTGATVHAFEPDPGFCEHLRRNVYLNGQEVTIHETALSDETGTTTLYTDGTAGTSPSLSDTEENRDEVTVEMGRVDDIDDTAWPDVVKIDVEGAEAAVVRGFGDRLAEIETLFVELHPEMLPGFDSSVDEVRELIEAHGFEPTLEQRREEQFHVIYQQ
ncbi:FkbM family methyltransferase [Natrinema sp. H-ect4]|uniref:FkbM family methyltransferase n=1 Tax=Natrinema sp. H-ect4 TaxID=3242699 RepID=UPI0035A8E22D